MTILKEADDLINGERQRQYDHPSEDFAFQGRVLGAMVERYLRKHVGGMENARVPAFPGWFMGLLAANCEKASHAIADPDHRDSWVDGVGYWGAGWKARKNTAPDGLLDRRDLGIHPEQPVVRGTVVTRTQADSPGEGWWGGESYPSSVVEALKMRFEEEHGCTIDEAWDQMFVGGRADHPCCRTKEDAPDHFYGEPDWEAAQKMTRDNTTPEDMGRCATQDLGVAPTEGE